MAPEPIDFVRSVSINPSQNAKILAGWYERFGIQTEEHNDCPKKKNPCVGYYKVTGSWFFAIHPKRQHAPKKSSSSVEVVFHVSDYDSYLAHASKNNIVPKCTEGDSYGRFAHFVDPD